MRTLRLLVLVPVALAAVAIACGGAKKEPATPPTDMTTADAGPAPAETPATPPADASVVVDTGSAAAATAVVDSGSSSTDQPADAGADGGKKKKKKKG